MSGLKTPIAWLLPAEAMQTSISEMAPDGVRGCEGVALWLGRRLAGVVSITHVIGLRGPGVIKRPDHLSISAELLDDVTDVAIERGVYLVGQIHSHPAPGSTCRKRTSAAASRRQVTFPWSHRTLLATPLRRQPAAVSMCLMVVAGVGSGLGSVPCALRLSAALRRSF